MTYPSSGMRLLVYKDKAWASQGAPWIVKVCDGSMLPRFPDGTDFRDDSWVGHFPTFDEAWGTIPGFLRRCADPSTEWSM